MVLLRGYYGSVPFGIGEAPIRPEPRQDPAARLQLYAGDPSAMGAGLESVGTNGSPSAALSQRFSARLELRSRSIDTLSQKIDHDSDLVRQERTAWIDEPGGRIERGRGHGVVR